MQELSYEDYRRRCLERCLRLRALLRNPERIAPPYGIENARYALNRERTKMMKLREWRRTGIYQTDN